MKNRIGTKRLNKLLAFLLRVFRIKKLSVYQLTISLLIITTFFSVGFIFVGWTYTEVFRVKAKIKDLKSISLNKQEEKLKTEVSRLISYLEYVQQDTNHHALEQIKEEALLYFENLRFGKDGYVFVNTYKGTALLFDGQKLDATKDISGLTDPNGFKIFEKELELAKLPEGGSFQYLFKKIYDATPQPKLSYVMGFDPWQWIIGTGDYLDNTEDEIFDLEQGLKRDMYNNILIASGVFLLVLFVLILAAYWFARWIQSQFANVVLNLKQAPFNKNIEASFESVFINELKTIGIEILQAEELAKQFGDIIDQSINEIYIFNQEDLRFVHLNRGAIQNSGYSLSEMKTMTPLDIKPDITHQQFRDIVMPLIQKKTSQIRFETVHQRKDKSLYPVEVFLTTSSFYKKKVFIAFVYDITERKESENQLLLSQQRYSGLFENAPVSLWEEDFTDVIEYLNEQMKNYQLDIEQLFEQHPEVLIQCAALVKVIDVNSQSVSLFEAQNKEELLGNLNKLFTENSIHTFEKSLLALYRGDKEYSSESENLTLTEKKLDVFLRWSFLAKDVESAQKVIVSILDLTELRKKEESLKEAQRIAKIGNWELDLITNKLYWSDEVYRLFDLKPQQFGATYEAFLDNIHPDDRELVNKAYTESLKTKEPYDIVHRLLLKDGKIKFVHEHCETFYDESDKAIRSVGTVQDITEKQKAKQDIEESKNKLESIFRVAPTGIGVVSNRVITEINEKFCQILGYSSQELLGKESTLVYPSIEEFEKVGQEKYKQIQEKGTGTVETQFKRKDGKIIDIILSSTPLDINDLSKGVTFTALDITERVAVLKELENHRNNLTEIVSDRTRALEESQDALLNLVDDLNHKSGELETSNTRLAEINEELETFTYSVSHDLKAPLRGIDGYSQLLLDDCKDDIGSEARGFLENIRKSTMQMSLLIEDLLAYSRMERKDFQMANVQLKPLIDNLVLAYAQTIDENKVQIKHSFPNAFVLKADKEGVNMVLRNLLDNALKFSSSNGAIQIEIGGSESDTHWHIFVKDNGIGFDMKYHDRIFKIFQRLHLAEEYEGTGIGLAMVSKAMQRMKGKIWAESEIGKGSCFYMEISK